jgi:hypothetical protein
MVEPVQDLSCREVVELATDYLEAALPPLLRTACDGHLAACPSCATYLDQLRQTVRLLARAVDETVPPETRESLLRRFRDLCQA